MKNKFQLKIAGDIGAAIQGAYPDKMSDILKALELTDDSWEDFIYSKIETPKDRKLGDFAFPTFLLAKPLHLAPLEITKTLMTHLDEAKYNLAGPYINAKLSASEIAKTVLPDIFDQSENYGNQAIGKGKRIVIDYSSPNIAKPFGVGHLRSTAIGNSLYKMFKKRGYEPIGINHIGDWGTQFGKLIYAFKEWGDRAALEKDPINHLFEIYVKFHQEEENNPDLAEAGREWFKKLEDGDEEAAHLWQEFRDLSLAEFQRIYDLLDIHFDYHTGESFYNDKMDDAIQRLEEAGLVSESRGAMVVDLGEDMPPCLLRKADGATLYATRDIAGLLYRQKTYDFYKALYVVGASQQEHFRQVFKVMEMLDADKFKGRLEHVEFGWIRFEDQAMSTRKGNIVFLDRVIEKAREKARQIIKEKNPELENLEETAEMVALGAILFADLGVKKHKDVNFRWEEVLNFEGETGPYLQYTHARLCSLMRRWGKEITADIDFNRFDSAEEKELMLHLYRFGEIIELAVDKYEPNFIAEYLINLGAVFNRFYQRKDNSGQLIRIISDDDDDTKARMLLVHCARTVMNEGLRLLGIKAPQEM